VVFIFYKYELTTTRSVENKLSAMVMMTL